MKRTKLSPERVARLNRAAVRNLRPRFRRPTAAELESLKSSTMTANASADPLVCNSGDYQFDLRHVANVEARVMFHYANVLQFVRDWTPDEPVSPEVDAAMTRLANAARSYVAAIDAMK